MNDEPLPSDKTLLLGEHAILAHALCLQLGINAIARRSEYRRVEELALRITSGMRPADSIADTSIPLIDEVELYLYAGREGIPWQDV